MPLSLSSFYPEKIIKSIYSSPINVHKNDLGLTLDLSYITKQLIVCSYPVTKYPKLLYRNSLTDLVSYLNWHHGVDNWRIYNFKAEYGKFDYSDEALASLLQESSSSLNSSSPLSIDENTATSARESRVTKLFSPDVCSHEPQTSSVEQYIKRYGWLDHSPPPFLFMQEVLDDIHQYLSESSSNVVLLHCKMGKGRSGSIVVAYMMKYMSCSLKEGRDIFMNNRFRAGITRGVTISSQLRFLRYHELFLHLERPLNRPHVLPELAKSRFTLSNMEITKPLGAIPPFNLDTNSCCISIKVQIYNEARNGLIDVFSTECDQLLVDPRCESQMAVVEINKTIAKSDICLSFGLRFRNNELIDNISQISSLSHCWLNLYWETVICSHNESLSNYTVEELTREQSKCRDGKGFALFCIKWDDLDGVKGTRNKGFKLFESVILRWKLV